MSGNEIDQWVRRWQRKFAFLALRRLPFDHDFAAAVADLHERRNRVCSWAQDCEGMWDTSCGNRFEFSADGPIENKTHFCPYCGGRLIPINWTHLLEEQPLT